MLPVHHLADFCQAWAHYVKHGLGAEGRCTASSVHAGSKPGQLQPVMRQSMLLRAKGTGHILRRWVSMSPGMQYRLTGGLTVWLFMMHMQAGAITARFAYA